MAGLDTCQGIRGGDVLEPVASAVEELRGMLDREFDVEPALHRICSDLVDIIGGADAAGVTLFRKGRPFTAARTDALVDRVDQCQYRTREGPCLEAARARRVVVAGEAVVRRQFPTFWDANHETGVRGFLSAPMTVDSGRTGAINIYTRDDRGLGRLEAAAARIYTSAAETVIAAAKRAWSAQSQLDACIRSMESRAVIEQCKGMLMTVFGISDDKAFELLRWRSQDTNVPVRILADRLLHAVTNSTSVDSPTRDHVGRLLMAPEL